MIARLKYWVSHNRILTSSLLALLFVLASRPTLLSMSIGLPIILLGEGIRIWSSGHIVKNDSLTTTGPYGLTRNPLYLGNFFLGLGFASMSGVPLLVVLFLPIFFFIYNATIAEEEKFLADRYGDRFKLYRETVPRFFPRINRAAFSTGSFNWSLVKKHREANTWLAIFGGLLIFLFKMWLFPGAS